MKCVLMTVYDGARTHQVGINEIRQCRLLIQYVMTAVNSCDPWASVGMHDEASYDLYRQRLFSKQCC